jgi:hypothetical protein
MGKREKRMLLILCLLMKNLRTFYPLKDVIFSLVLMHNLMEQHVIDANTGKQLS